MFSFSLRRNFGNISCTFFSKNDEIFNPEYTFNKAEILGNTISFHLTNIIFLETILRIYLASVGCGYRVYSKTRGRGTDIVRGVT